MLLQIGNPANIDLVRQLVQAHAYWRLKGLAVDLMIWNEDRGGYRQLLQEQIMGLIAAGVEAHVMDRQGGIFVRPRSRYRTKTAYCCNRLRAPSSPTAVATLMDQINRRGPAEVRVPRLKPTRPQRAELPAATGLPRRDLILFNGLGGFTRTGANTSSRPRRAS